MILQSVQIILMKKVIEPEEEPKISKTSTIRTSLSTDIKSKLEATLNRAEEKLRTSKHLPSISAIVSQEKAEDSQDSDISMRGKSWERVLHPEDQRFLGEGHSEEIESEDEDEKYYDNRKFERKVCNIELCSEASEDGNIEDDSKVCLDSFVENEQLKIIEPVNDIDNSIKLPEMEMSWEDQEFNPEIM